MLQCKHSCADRSDSHSEHIFDPNYSSIGVALEHETERNVKQPFGLMVSACSRLQESRACSPDYVGFPESHFDSLMKNHQRHSYDRQFMGTDSPRGRDGSARSPAGRPRQLLECIWPCSCGLYRTIAPARPASQS